MEVIKMDGQKKTMPAKEINAEASALASSPSLLDAFIQDDRVAEEPRTQPTYKINLKDRVAYANLALTNVCGNGSSTGGFTYDLTIKATAVDARGWVVDSRITDEIYTKWDSGQMWVASCEQLAGGLVNFVLEKIPSARQIIARVRNDRGDIEVEWNHGDERPIGPRLATIQEQHDKQESYYEGRRC